MIEGRVVAGDVVKVRVPGTGVDAEGDPVTVTGIVDLQGDPEAGLYGRGFVVPEQAQAWSAAGPVAMLRTGGPRAGSPVRGIAPATWRGGSLPR